MSVSPPPDRLLPYPAADQRLWDELSARPIICVPVNNAHVTQVLVEGPCILVGLFCHETGAAAGALDLYDGRDTTGVQAGSQNIASGGSVSIGPSDVGVFCRRGLTMAVTTSTLKGAVWVKM